MNFGIAVKSIRKKLDISQAELAGKCGLSQTSLSQIETGSKRPSPKTIQNICNVLEIPESIVYIVAMQEKDISSCKKELYNVIYPSLKSLALQVVSNEMENPTV